MAVRVVEAAFNSSGLPDGVARAPQALREAGLLDQVAPTLGARPDAEQVDVGTPLPERDPVSRLLAVDSLQVATASLRRAVSESLRDGDLPLVVGGDCPVLLGSLRGAADVLGAVGLLFVDGHEDAWPPTRSTTGEAADCELGFLLGLHLDELPEAMTRLLPTLDPRTVVALGPRDADELAENAVASIGDRIVIRTDRELVGHDLGAPESAASAATDATAAILGRVDHWWLHVDLDVLSTDALPAVDYPQPGGLSWPMLESLSAAALAAPGCVGVTLCIYNPDLDPDRRHAARIVSYAAQLCRLLPR